MKLTSFRVGPYRSVLDAGEIAVDPEVTGLVGKNESGETNPRPALLGSGSNGASSRMSGGFSC